MRYTEGQIKNLFVEFKAIQRKVKRFEEKLEKMEMKSVGNGKKT